MGFSAKLHSAPRGRRPTACAIPRLSPPPSPALNQSRRAVSFRKATIREVQTIVAKRTREKLLMRTVYPSHLLAPSFSTGRQAHQAAPQNTISPSPPPERLIRSRSYFALPGAGLCARLSLAVDAQVRAVFSRRRLSRFRQDDRRI